MILQETDSRYLFLHQTAIAMMSAARTAPKGKGRDTLSIITIEDDDIEPVAQKMEQIAEQSGQKAFARDAKNLREAGIAVIIATSIQALGLAYCGCCGFENCAGKNQHSSIPCAFNTMDLGIALGSAASIAADRRVDSRIMYTVGMAAKELGLLGDNIAIACALAISISSKNPFFDR